MGSRLLIITFRELAHQLFEDVSHIHCTDLFGTHIGILRTELLDHVVVDAIMIEFCDFLVKVELLDDIHHVLKEVVHR